MKKSMEIIATRRLTVVGPEPVTVTIHLGRPRKKRRAEWVCPFKIMGLGATIVGDAPGEDALQAIGLAFEAIRVSLERTGLRFAWLGSEELGTGIARSVPVFLPPEYLRRANEAIDNIVAAYATAAQKRTLRSRR